MRILHYSLGFSPYRSGGMTRYVEDLMEVQKKDHEVGLLWPGRMKPWSPKITIKKQMRASGIISYEMMNPLPVPLLEGVRDIRAYMGKGDLDYFLTFLRKEKPDVIHIFGSEFTHAYAAAKAAEAKGMLDNTILNLQGIMAECAKHYTDCLPQKVIKRYTLKDIVSGNTIKNQQKDFVVRAEWEEKLLGMVKHVIGRTDFDKSFALKANPMLNYYFMSGVFVNLF